MLVLENKYLKFVLQALILGTAFCIALLYLDNADVFTQMSLGMWSSSLYINHTLKLQDAADEYDHGQVNTTIDKLQNITENQTIEELLPKWKNTTQNLPQHSSTSTVNETITYTASATSTATAMETSPSTPLVTSTTTLMATSTTTPTATSTTTPMATSTTTPTATSTTTPTATSTTTPWATSASTPWATSASTIFLTTSNSTLIATTNTTSVTAHPTLGAITMSSVSNVTNIPSEKLMTSRINGRLGNVMGVHAVSLGLAQMNGFKPVMGPESAAVLQLYFDFQTPTMNKESQNKSWTIKAPTDHMQEVYRHWNEPYIRVQAYLNSWTFYHHIRPTILKEFTFKKDLRDEAQRILHDILNKLHRNATFVGVHVRRTDYVRLMREVYNGVLADKHYIDEAMTIFRSRYKNAAFIIASDDYPWCQANINSSLGDTFILGVTNKTSPGQDMATLVACNHTIMTIGTFGHWASYLCGGDVIYLTNYTLPNKTSPTIQNYSSYYFPEWHGLAADLSPILNLTTTQVSTATTQTKAVT